MGFVDKLLELTVEHARHAELGGAEPVVGHLQLCRDDREVTGR